jgi:hypothetical protein
LAAASRQDPKPLSEAEQALKAWGIKYEKKPEGTLFVPSNLDINHRGLTKLPDLSSVIVGGNIYCFNNRFTSLEGAPTRFKELWSDFGTFASWDHVPEELRTPPLAKDPPVKRPRGFNL